MGRSERPLGNEETPAEIFAAELRRLRAQAGNPTYLKMHRACGKIRSKTALSEAAGGDHLPTWETVEAYVSALGRDPAAWRCRWEEAQDQERGRRERGVVPMAAERAGAAPDGEDVPARRYPAVRLKLSRPSVRVLAVAVGSAGVAGALSLLVAASWDHGVMSAARLVPRCAVVRSLSWCRTRWPSVPEPCQKIRHPSTCPPNLSRGATSVVARSLVRKCGAGRSSLLSAR